MTLEAGQFSYRDLVFGEGTDYYINSVEGFEGSDIRSSDSDQPRGDGAIRGLDYVAPKTIALELAIIEPDFAGGDGSVYESMWLAIRTAFRPSRQDDFELKFKRPGMPERLIRCRPVQLVRSETFKRYNRVGFPPIVLRAVDPRIYSTEEHNAVVPIYAASQGGADLSVVNFPVDFIGGNQIEIVVNNSGTDDAYPLLRFYGPATGTCTGVELRNTTNGDIIEINTTISAGEILTADMGAATTGDSRLIISLGGSSRYGSWELPREPFRLSPGSNTLRLLVTGSSTDVICVVTHRDTWIS